MALVFKAKNILLIRILWPLQCPQWLHCHRPRRQQPWEQAVLLLFPLLLPSLLPEPLLPPLLTFPFLQLLALDLQLLLHQKKWLVRLIQVPTWGKGLKTCLYIGDF